MLECKTLSRTLKDSAADSRLKILGPRDIYGEFRPGGEKRIHIGTTSQEKEYDDFFFPDGGEKVILKVNKIDLIDYLLSAKEEFFNPKQEYRMPIKEYYEELYEDILNISSVSIDIQLNKNTDSKRYYLSPQRGGNYKYVNEISLPLITEYKFIRLNSDNEYTFYLKPIFIGVNNEIKEEQDNNILVSSDPLQQIYYGAPGTGKSFEINKITLDESVVRTTFHPDSDYSTFVGAYKPTSKKVKVMTTIGTKAVQVEDENGEKVWETKIEYKFVPQAFLNAYINAWKFYADAENCNEVKKQFLVIEEINRGNCAQIFGDLFQLLDRNANGFSDYPIEADADMEKQLKEAFEDVNIPLAEQINSQFNGKDMVSDVLSGKILLLPNNLYIWATMNTSDQSLFPIDSAFKRRWDWKYMPISDGGKNYEIVVGTDKYSWWDFLTAVNDLIDNFTHSEDKKLGYFFCKTDKEISAETFVGKVIFYLWNDVFKDYEFSDDKFNDPDGGKLSFDKFYESDGNVKLETINKFLKNLELNPTSISSEDEDESNQGSMKFSLNGDNLSLGDIAKKVVENYINDNPNLTAVEVRDFFINKFKNIGISHIVETDSEFQLRKEQPSAKRSVKEVIINNNEKLYVSTQWRAANESDNFIKFMHIVNKEGLGRIEKLS